MGNYYTSEQTDQNSDEINGDEDYYKNIFKKISKQKEYVTESHNNFFKQSKEVRETNTNDIQSGKMKKCKLRMKTIVKPFIDQIEYLMINIPLKENDVKLILEKAILFVFGDNNLCKKCSSIIIFSRVDSLPNIPFFQDVVFTIIYTDGHSDRLAFKFLTKFVELWNLINEKNISFQRKRKMVEKIL